MQLQGSLVEIFLGPHPQEIEVTPRSTSEGEKNTFFWSGLLGLRPPEERTERNSGNWGRGLPRGQWWEFLP